jgi:spoIIIJ-associated protein
MTEPVTPAEGAVIDGSTGHPDEAPVDQTAAAPRVSLERLEREGEIAADYLETLLDVTDLDGDIDVDIDGDRAAVAIVDSEEGRVPRRLVGRDGEVLDALQELTRLAVLAASGERSRLMLDIAGYRAGRREALVKRAAEVAAQVKASGTKVALEPMSPFERKVVHDAVAAEGLLTESEGVEPERHVVVLPA